MPIAGDDDDGHHHHQQPLPAITTTAALREPPLIATLVTVFLDSFKIFLSHPRLFSSIFLLLALPLSLLLSSLSFSSATVRRRITHLESLAAIISVRIEALNILEEARKDAKALLRLRAAYALPALLLSTLVLVTSASSAAAHLLRRRRPTASSARAAVRSAWWRGLVTGAIAHVSVAGYGQLMRTTAIAVAAVAGPATGLFVGVVSGAAEVYLTAVFAVATVASVVDERYGLDAIRFGWSLIGGRRVTGWAVAAATTAATAVVGWEMVGVEEIDVYGADWRGFESTAVMEFGRRAGLVCLYALVMTWSNVLVTVFYCDCRRKKYVAIVDDDVNIVDNNTNII